MRFHLLDRVDEICYMTGPLIAEEDIIPLLKIKLGWSIGAIVPADLNGDPGGLH